MLDMKHINIRAWHASLFATSLFALVWLAILAIVLGVLVITQNRGNKAGE